MGIRSHTELQKCISSRPPGWRSTWVLQLEAVYLHGVPRLIPNDIIAYPTGLLDDALREYYELEAVYLEAVQAGQLARQGFGGKAPDADEAGLMWQSWHGIRQVSSVHTYWPGGLHNAPVPGIC